MTDTSPSSRGAGSLKDDPVWQAAMDWLQAEGPRTVWIGVWSQNPGAQRFYARHGFEKVGEHTFPVGRVVDLEFTLRREKGATPA